MGGEWKNTRGKNLRPRRESNPRPPGLIILMVEYNDCCVAEILDHRINSADDTICVISATAM